MWLKYNSSVLRVNKLGWLVLVAILLTSVSALAAETGSPAVMKVVQPAQAVELIINLGSSYLLPCEGLTKVAVGDPAIADVVPVSTRELLINGKAVGSTNLYVWDNSVGSGLRAFRVKIVSSQADIAAIAYKINGEIGGTGVLARPIGDSVMLEGTVNDPFVSQRAEAVASAYSKNVKNMIQVVQPVTPTGAVEESLRSALQTTGLTVRALSDGTIAVEGRVATAQDAERIAAILKPWAGAARLVNLVQQAPVVSRQILIRTRVLEINRRKAKDLGVDWDQPFVIGEAALGPFALLDGGPIRRLDPLAANINLLIEQKAARVLSEPNLLVADGNTASMLVGGEIPIPVVQNSSSSSAASVSIEWKEFGVRLNVQPTIGEGDTIQMNVAPEVSNLDATNGVTFGGFEIPALISRKTQTVVQVNNGQSLMISGLFNSEDVKTVRRIPLLSQIPLIGEFFKNTSTQRVETELVILVTPEIVEPGGQPAAQATTVPALEQQILDR